MAKKLCFVSIDIEHDTGTQDAKIFQGVDEMKKVLDIFETFSIPLTLFVTGDVLEKYRERVKVWAEKYEIASHSYAHRYFNELSAQEKEEDIKKFIKIYKNLFGQNPKGFRAPSHVIDDYTFDLLKKYGFTYDSSVVPHYPPLKKYRGYTGRAPLIPYKIGGLMEIPATGQLMGIPLGGAWIRKLPIWFYEMLFSIHKPDFITLSMHSWDVLDARFLPKLIKILEILKNNGYVFKSGEQIAVERAAE